MALSAQVKEAVDSASKSVREALAFAARSEHPTTIASLTEILVRLESLDAIDQFLDKLSKQRDAPKI